MNCIFCRIAAGEIPAQVVYEDDRIMAFRDIQPAAPVHVLVIPKKHIDSVCHVTESDADLLAHLHAMLPTVAESAGVPQSGMRLVSNVGSDGGQTVPHLHYHLLGGRSFAWPPG